MEIKFQTLILQCKKSREILDLSHQISFFHGMIGSGKSSLVRLIDYCFGGNLEMTPAIQSEVVSVSLLTRIGKYETLLEREISSDNIQITWKDSEENTTTLLTPIKDSGTPVWEDLIYNFSDLVFYLLGIDPLKVHRSSLQKDSPLIRLSFRNFMWYCYLKQDHLDSSFFRLEDQFRMNKSRDVMKFVVGFYSEKLNNLQIELEKVTDEKLSKISTAKELRNFFERFGYNSGKNIENEIESTQKVLNGFLEERNVIEQGYIKDTHITDSLRKKLREISSQLEKEEIILEDLKERIEEQTSLKAEFLSSKFKLAKSQSISNVLSKVTFTLCPSCGTNIENRKQESDSCYLCGSEYSNFNLENELSKNAETIRIDLDSRIIELENSIKNHKDALIKQEKVLNNLYVKKITLDKQLKKELENYESIYLSSYRDIDTKVATYIERLNGLERLKQIPNEITVLETEADNLEVKEKRIRHDINEEKKNLISAENYIVELEETFLQTLLKVGLPGINKTDKIQINRITWEVNVMPYGEEYLKWNFYNAGSGGKKTLFNVCYALSVHILASKYNLPLPTFLIIDTPMKNISEDVNRDLFENFYNYLYELTEGYLKGTQIVLVDKEFIKPQNKVDIWDRYMTPDNPEAPPLIPYYTGLA